MIERTSHPKYFLPRVDVTSYNVLIDGRNFSYHSVSNTIKKYDNIRKITTGLGNDYSTGCLLDFQYCKDHY